MPSPVTADLRVAESLVVGLLMSGLFETALSVVPALLTTWETAVDVLVVKFVSPP